MVTCPSCQAAFEPECIGAAAAIPITRGRVIPIRPAAPAPRTYLDVAEELRAAMEQCERAEQMFAEADRMQRAAAAEQVNALGRVQRLKNELVSMAQRGLA